MPNDHLATSPTSTLANRPASPRRPTLGDRIVMAAAARTLPRLDAGCLTLVLPSGAQTTFYGPSPGSQAVVAIRSFSALWNTLRRGKLGFAEAFMDGTIEIDDLEQLFHFFLDNDSTLDRSSSHLFKVKSSDRRYHAGRDNTREGSRRNISAHYDLGNDFYSLWLDRGMSYSSAIYPDPAATLEEAQALKHARIIDALGLEPHHHVLEIGCGWGSLAQEIAPHCADFRGITVSAQQLQWSRARLASAGLASNSTIAFEDYRDTRGSFDRIASVEMIEAVGEAHWPTYFQILADRLKPGGRGILQAITIPEKYFASYRSAPDFIQRYIFPGGMLPTIEAMQHHARAAGLTFSIVEQFSPSYARTLREWRTRFNEAWPQIKKQGFDDRFHRMWNYYLAYCAVGFERQCVEVGLYRVDKPQQ